MIDWQDIATAPKDGRNVLLCCEYTPDVGVSVERYYFECWHRGYWLTAHNCSKLGNGYTPTHWVEINGPEPT